MKDGRNGERQPLHSALLILQSLFLRLQTDVCLPTRHEQQIQHFQKVMSC